MMKSLFWLSQSPVPIWHCQGNAARELLLAAARALCHEPPPQLWSVKRNIRVNLGFATHVGPSFFIERKKKGIALGNAAFHCWLKEPIKTWHHKQKRQKVCFFYPLVNLVICFHLFLSFSLSLPPSSFPTFHAFFIPSLSRSHPPFLLLFFSPPPPPNKQTNKNGWSNYPSIRLPSLPPSYFPSSFILYTIVHKPSGVTMLPRFTVTNLYTEDTRR